LGDLDEFRRKSYVRAKFLGAAVNDRLEKVLTDVDHRART
jgi:hypothetical protein